MASNLKRDPAHQASTGPKAATKHIGPMSSVTKSKVSVASLNKGQKTAANSGGKNGC